SAYAQSSRSSRQAKPWPPIVTDARPPGPEPVAPRGHAPQGKTSSQDCSSDLLLRRNGLRQSRGGSVEWIADTTQPARACFLLGAMRRGRTVLTSLERSAQ